MKERFLGIDFGDKSMGLALSTDGIAYPLTTLKRRSIHQDMRALSDIVEEYTVTSLVLGYPLHMNGKEGARCKQTRIFKDALNTHFPSVILWDERLTSKEADQILDATNTRKNRSIKIHQVCASLILQSFLDAQRLSKKPVQPPT